MRRLVILLLLALPPVSLGGCFDFDEPVCSFKCGGGTTCPDDYECRSDGYCHKENTTDVCSFSDGALASDLSAATDLTDGSTNAQDLSSNDGSTLD